MAINFSASTTLKMIDRLSAPLARVQKRMDKFSRSLRTVRRAGRGLQTAGRSIVRTVALPAAAVAANSLRVTGDFQKAMNLVESRLNGVSDDVMKRLNDRAKELGATTQFSASQAASGMTFLAQAGLGAEKILASIEGQLHLAAAGTIELGEAADISTNIMSQFGMSFDLAGKNLTRMNDVLATTAASTNTDILEMAEAMKQAGPVANAFGLDIEASAAMVGLLANAGIKGSDAGTGLKTMMARLAAPSGKSIKTFKKLGITQSDLFKKMDDGKIVFLGAANMMDVFEKSGADAIDMLEVLGLRSGPKTLAMFSQGAGSLRNLEGSLRNAGGAAERMALIQMKGLPGVFARGRSAWEALNIALTESGALDGIIKILERVTISMQKLSTQPEKLAKFAKIVKIISALGAGLLVFGTAISAITSVMIPFLTVMSLMTISSVTLSAAIAPMLIVFGAIPLAIAAVVVVGVLLFKNWSKITSFFEQKLPNISKLFRTFAVMARFKLAKLAIGFGELKRVLGLFAKFVGNRFAAKLQEIDLAIGSLMKLPDEIKKAWDGLPEFFSNLMSSIVAKFQSKMLVMLKGLKSFAKIANSPLHAALTVSVAKLEHGIATQKLEQPISSQKAQETISSQETQPISSASPGRREVLDVKISGEVKGAGPLNVETASVNKTKLLGNVGFTNSALGF